MTRIASQTVLEDIEHLVEVAREQRDIIIEENPGDLAELIESGWDYSDREIDLMLAWDGMLESFRALPRNLQEFLADELSNSEDADWFESAHRKTMHRMELELGRLAPFNPDGVVFSTKSGRQSKPKSYCRINGVDFEYVSR